MPSAPKCTANNVGWNDKAVQEVVRIPKTANNLGIDTSTGSTGDPYDIAVAESINGLYKAEVIHRKSGENRTEVELVTLTWVDWYNNRRLLEKPGHISPAEAEKAYYASIGNNELAAEFTDKIHSRKHRAVQIISTLRNFFQVRDIAGKE